MRNMRDDMPVPRKRHPRSALRQAIEDMQVGQSGVLDGPAANIRAALQAVGKRLGHRHVTRKVVEDGVAGLRIWRVE